ncbi:acyl-CoA synthetase [Dermatobacter hominis]|uniref:acyl-CoA synthetase n=1 Tax=Dermatobacter hominis TaxID=2884263 RepID=UPI001D12189D|nr:acyl-CoA synthetase [Dermatobacter hominis]UDY35272.1 acyl-CoA synthetase [Dermatobacter hominis]
MTSGTPDRDQFDLATVSEVVAAAVPDREAIIFGDRRLTYADLAERTRRLASYLHDHGVGCHTERSELQPHESGQDHVALYLYNGNEYIEGMLGCVKARAVSFNVNYRYVAEELRYLFDNASARGVIYHSTFAPVVAELLASMTDEERDRIAVLLQVDDGSGEALLPGAVDYEEALAASDPAGPGLTPSPDDLYIVYTGGTTGMPKGVLWRSHDIFMNAMGGKEVGTWIEVGSYDEIAERARSNAGFRLMTLPPLMHGAAQWAAFMMLNAGSTLIVPQSRNMDPAEVWTLVEREGIQSVVVVGDAMARPLLEELQRGSYDTSSLFVLGNGGAAFSAALKEEFLELLPDLMINDSLGSSETGAQASTLSTKGGVSAAEFQPGPGATVVSEDLSSVLEPGHEGIGWSAQSGAVPLGYLGDAAKTAATFPTIEGVRYSVPGDRAIWRPDGVIELLGRDSQCINSGGEKIFVEEVEQAIISHPDVADVLVCGRPSERWGNEVVAVVQLAEGATADEDSLARHANGSIARYKLPKAWIVVDRVQRSPSGKADYRWAKELAASSAG